MEFIFETKIRFHRVMVSTLDSKTKIIESETLGRVCTVLEIMSPTS